MSKYLTIIALMLFGSSCFAGTSTCVTVGVIGEFKQPTEGYTRFFGTEAMRGATLAVAYLRQSNPDTCINLKPIETENSLANIPELIYQAAAENIHIFIGLDTSDQAIMAIHALNQTHSMLFAQTVSADQFENSNNIITYFPSNRQVAKVIAQYLINENVKQLTIIYAENRYYSKQIMKDFFQEYTKMGGKINYSIAVSSGNVNINPYANILKSSNGGYIFIPLFDLDAAIAILELQRMGVHATLIGSDSWDSYLDKIETYLSMHISNESISTIIPVIYNKNGSASENSLFVKNFEGQYKKSPTDIEAFSYDSILTINKLLNVCSVSMISKNPRSCISKIFPIKTTTGNILKNKNNEMTRPIIIKKIIVSGKK